MIQLIGQTSLVCALILSLLQWSVPLLGLRNQHAIKFLAAAKPAAWGQCLASLVAYALLTYAFYKNDFSLQYVAANSHESLSFMYRITAVWGAHEGSILLWIVILSCWTVVYSIAGKKQTPAFYSLVIANLGSISFCFLSFLLFTSNPFLPADGYQSGKDLNPLLQDPGFVIHPPMLYIGYVGLAVAYAITQSALILNRFDQSWARITRQFAEAAWCFLTFGIMLGSWWAYRVLGWGGFWFWDPVENASLLPWLAATALIHVLVLVEKRQSAIAWAAFLSLTCFALSVLGTFLVRSGVLISAHTFANDPARGIVLLVMLAILSVIALGLFFYRLPQMVAIKSNIHPKLLSRENSLLLNSALLFIAMLTILLGTLYPLIFDAFKLGSISVGPPYFNSVMLPLVFVSMIFMGFGALCRWEHQSLATLWKKSWRKLLGSILAALVVLWCVTETLTLLPLFALALSFWVITSVMNSLRFLPAVTIAHMGFAIMIIGIVLSSLISQEKEVRVTPGQFTSIGPYQFLFVQTSGIKDSNYHGIQATFEVTKQGRHIANLYPEKRIYTVRDMIITKVDIHPGIFRDLYIALGEPLSKEEWSVRLYYKPFLRFIWLGAFIMMVGGFFAVFKRNDKG